MPGRDAGSDNKWISILSFFLAISVALNIILSFKAGDLFPSKKELALENSSMKKQIQLTKNELKKFSGISMKIDAVVAEANIKLEEKEKQINAIKREKSLKVLENQNLKLQIDSLQERVVNMIDSLLVEREKTRAINVKIDQMEELISGLKIKVGLGSTLLGDNLSVLPIKKIANGKKQSTAIAKRITEIEVCVDLLENKLSKPGTRQIYFVITSPNAKVIADKNGGTPEFFNPEFNTNALCSKVEKIDYKNQKVSICTSIRPSENMPSGLYILEAFSDETKLGMTTFMLR